MKVLVAHSYFLCHDAKQTARMTPYAPLSTLIAAAGLRGQGYEIALFDSTFCRDVSDFEIVLDQVCPNVVAILEDNFNFLTKMCTVRRREAALAMVRAAKARGCRVVVNGPDSTDQPQIYLEAGVDAVLAGEGEGALFDLAGAWWRGEPADAIEGLIHHDAEGGVARTRPRAVLRDLDKLPFPAWDLLDVAAYRQAWRDKHGYFSWNVATSRGCPYRCNWCAKPTFGRGYEQRSPQSVAQELRELKYRVAPDHIWFADDIFGLAAEWLEAFAEEVERLDALVPYTMQSRVNLMKDRAVAALARSGSREVWLGVESGSQKILDAMEKGSLVEEASAATRKLRAAGIRVCWFIQLGYPGENWEDITLTRELIQAEKPDDIGVSVAYPLPGTRFHEMVRAELGERKNWEDSDDLAMLFQGAFDTTFYRKVRDALHDEVREGRRDDCRWARLSQEADRHSSSDPVLLATGS